LTFHKRLQKLRISYNFLGSTFNQWVTGSNPVGITILSKGYSLNAKSSKNLYDEHMTSNIQVLATAMYGCIHFVA